MVKGITRRDLISVAAASTLRLPSEHPLIVPLNRVMDSRAQYTPDEIRRFWYKTWPEAAKDFGRCGIRFQTTDVTGEIRRSPGDRPIFVGLQPGVLNLVLTDHIPMTWDHGRALAGVTVIYGGRHLCLIALRYAHAHQVPFLSVNTCVHELLHALLQDVFIPRPAWYQEGGHEFRVDWYATRLWLFHEGAAIRASAKTYLDRLR